ncbi:hypothetical protein [Maridesulfovibrio zosterae]|uniref:hypothetical protein n=1 Tax=Maridesulfovibrio zosterae TaxID=82171 RepID=UPI0004833B12|nr:hypothetical protein [Maridesulfovibrio zosterae]
MTNTITKYIEYLRKEFGSYSQSAKFLSVDPRSYRKQRKDLVKSNRARRSIVLSAKYLQLRRTICVLRDEYGVPLSDIRAACRKVKIKST